MGLNFLLSPQGFLKVGGVILIVVALLGFIGIIGPTSNSLFDSWWYFDNAENWAHLVLGVVALIAAFTFPANINKMLVMALGVVGVLVGLYSLFGSVPEGTVLLGAMLQNPLDTLLHLVVGIWALAAGFKKVM
ncbi:MAG: hypothetical protein AAB340_00215 [Patescibacteria group bacterium]